MADDEVAKALDYASGVELREFERRATVDDATGFVYLADRLDGLHIRAYTNSALASQPT